MMDVGFAGRASATNQWKQKEMPIVCLSDLPQIPNDGNVNDNGNGTCVIQRAKTVQVHGGGCMNICRMRIAGWIRWVANKIDVK
jgi:hypothetical protein